MSYYSHLESDVIDLTNSFTLVDHCALNNAVIDLDTTDDSIHKPAVNNKRTSKERKSTQKKKESKVSPNKIEKRRKRKSSKFGDCPICWEELGNNPLASTKCGHVYCLQCIQQSLSVERKCPTCRCVLKGASAYHPLYLARN